jgi:hypothetical protein
MLSKIPALVDQPEKIELEYRVIAINKAREGPPSTAFLKFHDYATFLLVAKGLPV